MKNLQKAFETLKNSTTEDKRLYEWLLRAFQDIQKNAFCGIQIPKKLIPKEYEKKYGVKNLWKYNMPNAWRLIYSIEGSDIRIISIILEWLDHKNYERRFGY
jgi:Txe/YoeB family toxin of Txe-Axe toxin-antitoxin module